MSNERIDNANKLVSRYALYAAGGGLIPVPTLDVAAIVAVQVSWLPICPSCTKFPSARIARRPS
jgi:hypothetical protein